MFGYKPGGSMISYGISHKGYVRQENQDAFINMDIHIGPLQNIYIVADGMGGHQGGAMASRLAVDTVLETVKQSEEQVVSALHEGMEKANKVIFEKALNDGSLFGMGTTADIVTLEGSMCHVAHIGDSRVYAVKTNQMVQLSKDHSYVQELVDAGAITHEEAYRHPNKNRITKALGVDKTIEPDFKEYCIEEDWEYILLCSDGLTNMLHDDEILFFIQKDGTLEERVDTMLRKALDLGGTDNITIVLVDLSGGDPS